MKLGVGVALRWGCVNYSGVCQSTEFGAFRRSERAHGGPRSSIPHQLARADAVRHTRRTEWTNIFPARHQVW